MMIKIIIVVGFLPCILFGGYGFQCVSRPDAHTTVTSYFTDQLPEFSQEKVVLDTNGKVVSKTKTAFFTNTTVCGISVNFKEGCNTHVMTEGNDFNYSFRCDDAFGDLVFLQSSGKAYFRCQGDAVSTELHAITLGNCR